MNEAATGTGEAPAEIEQEGIPEEEFAKISQAYTEYMNQIVPGGKQTDEIVKGMRSVGEMSFGKAEDWQKLAAPRNELIKSLTENCKIEGFKQHIKTLFAVMGSEFLQKKISDASEAYQSNKIEENRKTLQSFLMTSAKWQGDCVAMIRDFENMPGGEELISLMWEKLDYFSAQTRAYNSVDQNWKSLQLARSEGIGNARKLKYGTLSPRLVGDTVGYVTKGLNISVLTGTLGEDVKGGTDMVLVNEDNQMRCAMQIKSSHRGVGAIECKGIDRFKPSDKAASDQEKEEIKRDNNFLEKVQKNNIAEVAMWVKVLGTEEEDVNQSTGKPNEEYLVRQKDVMGQSIRRLLKVRQEPLAMAA